MTPACLRMLSTVKAVYAERGMKIRGWARNDEEAAGVQTTKKRWPAASRRTMKGTACSTLPFCGLVSFGDHHERAIQRRD